MMNGAACFYWFEAVQGARPPQQLGEFSDAELAARQPPRPRVGLAGRIGRLLAGLPPQPVARPVALSQA